ncbi:hypothetical protein HF086_009528 [Spodoptera exigua]|uniref:Uncharacterized protein n=1 Tax=Spodoptera exigua TaxID=7107 RepID=A0A922MEK3_SPOEX|nr:hypothetical protein HF086_009528 [Spodoptera exigua]
MSVNNRKGPIVDPGICRCCGSIKKCRLLNVEYEWSGQREVYADMFVDCFGLVLSHLEGEESERLICATCVVRLRDARAFRQQVLLCEEKLLNAQPTTVDKDLHMLRNIVKIVENSYVCPFVTVFSDYHCFYCKEMFLDPTELRIHTLTHDPKTYKTIIDIKKLILIDIDRIDCRLCDEKIDSIDIFKEHITSRHGQKLYRDVSNEFMPFKLKIGTLKCVECDKNFGFFHALKKHMAVHFGTFVCDECGAHYFEERHLVFHKNSHVKKAVEWYPCNECDKTFRSKYSRSFHVARIHKNEPAYPCNKCDEVFISYHMRYRHKMNVHGEKRQFPCDGCDKIFVSRKTLREHNQRTHLQLFRHQCSLCDKKFYLPSALRDHMTSHTGERNFRCEFCGKNYPRSKALKVHLQSHSSEKKFKCRLCPSAYTQVTNYRNHMKTKHPVQDGNNFG